MLDQCEKWIKEVADFAIERKRYDARAQGDESSWENEIWKSPQKNKELKERFAQEANKHGYEARSSIHKGEWLYDCVWLQRNTYGFLSRTILAMEIELGERESLIIEDFEKLLQSDCPYRLMFFQMYSSDQIKGVLKRLEERANSYKFSVEAEFLLAGWATSEHNLLFQHFAEHSV